MDLGATICTPRKPRCVLCPWREDPAARTAAGIAEELPRRAEKPVRPRRQGIAFWVVDGDGAILLRRRAAVRVASGMMETPSTRHGPRLRRTRAPSPMPRPWPRIGVRSLVMVRHVFTHFELTQAVRTARIAGKGDPEAGYWVKPDNCDYALPSLMTKIIRHALAKGSAKDKEP